MKSLEADAMRNVLLLTLILIAISVSPVARADTPLDVLGVEKSINDLSQRAQETGDQIAEAFAKQALKVIAAWKKANANLIDKAFDKLDKQSQALFRELNDTATRLENGEAVTTIDLQQTMATAGSVLARIPGSSQTPQVTFYWPTMLLPVGEPKITIHVIGSRLADANPTASFKGHSIPVEKTTDNEIELNIDRDALPINEEHRTQTAIKIVYNISTSHWYNPFSWWSNETRERDIELNVLPKVPATALVIATVQTVKWQTKVDGPITVGGRGKDSATSYGYTITPLEQQQGWILDKEAQEKAQEDHQWDDNHGSGNGGSSCSGYDVHSFTNKSLSFKIQYGHVTHPFGHKSDAHQNCRIWVHLKHLVKNENTGAGQKKPLNWIKDVDVQLPNNTVHYSIALSLYDGRSYQIENDSEIPYGLFQIFRYAKNVDFRPRPQRDF